MIEYAELMRLGKSEKKEIVYFGLNREHPDHLISEVLSVFENQVKKE
jgi:hypothetical protein